MNKKIKETLEEYLIENGIFDKFIYNVKNGDIIRNREVSMSSFDWVDSIEGSGFWVKQWEKAPSYDGSMDWIIDDSNEELFNDYIIFNSMDEIKEAIKSNAFDLARHDHPNVIEFPVIFAITSFGPINYLTNRGSENIWAKDKYRKWVSNSITWSMYKSKMEIPEKSEPAVEPKKETKKHNWIGCVYGKKGVFLGYLKEDSEYELNDAFARGKYEECVMDKYQFVSTRIEKKIFIDTNTDKEE